MQVKLVADDDVLLRCKTEGDIVQTAFNPNQEPIAEMFGEDVYKRNFLLDLEDSPYMDSSGVSWVLKCHKHFRDAGGKLVVHSITPMVKQLFSVLRMDKVLNLAETLGDARRMVAEDAA